MRPPTETRRRAAPTSARSSPSGQPSTRTDHRRCLEKGSIHTVRLHFLKQWISANRTSKLRVQSPGFSFSPLCVLQVAFCLDNMKRGWREDTRSRMHNVCTKCVGRRGGGGNASRVPTQTWRGGRCKRGVGTLFI